jgi:high-affinity iron transporter
VLAVTRSVSRRNRWIGGGVLAGVAAACLVAAFAGVLSQLFEGMGQELFNAAILAIAVIMLTWHNVWMARHGKEIAGEMRAIGQAVAEEQIASGALAVVVAVAVLREARWGRSFPLWRRRIRWRLGRKPHHRSLMGLALGVAVCLLTYFELMRIPPRALFATTTVLITLLAAGMAAQAVAFLQRANWPTPLDTVMWDSGWLLSESSIVGRALHTLVGYTDQPTGMQIVIYLAVILVTVMVMRLVGSERRQHAIAAG